jgi:hypothetical protein
VFRLKGSGWYETDFKTGNKKNLAGMTSAVAGRTTTAGVKPPLRAAAMALRKQAAARHPPARDSGSN